MKKIFPDILKSEENISGFAPGDPDDDIFLLESQEYYPAEIPDFADDTDIIAVSDNALASQSSDNDSGVDNTIYDTPEEGSVWDIFDKEPDEEQQASLPENEQIPDDYNYAFDKSEELEDNVSIDSSEKDESDNDIFSEETENSTEDDKTYNDYSDLIAREKELNSGIETREKDDLASNPMDEVDEDSLGRVSYKPDTPDEEVSEDVVLDDDLLSSLKKDLSKKKKEKPQAPEYSNPETDNKPLFQAEKGAKDETYVDITALKFDKPSTVNSVENVSAHDLNSEDKETIEANVRDGATKQSDNKIENDSFNKDKKEKKEKKERTTIFPWVSLGTSAAVFLFLFLFGIAGYYAWNKYALGLFEHKEEISHADTKQTAEKPHEVAKKIEPKEEFTKIDNSLKTDSSEHIAVKSDSAEISKPEPEKVVQKIEPVAETKVEPKVVEKTVEKPKPIEKKVEKPVTIAKNEAVPVKVPTPKVSKPKTDAVKPKPAEKPKQDSKSIVSANETKQAGTTSIVIQADEVYTVQVYSSPSLEDAETWLRQMAGKQIQGGYISPQKIRDQTWYRVRFGKFPTRDEARAVAAKHGYLQSWVDRIK